MPIPNEVLALLSYVAKREAEGERTPNCADKHSDDAITYAASHGLISLSLGSWQEDAFYCGLKNKGREALGLPRKPTIWDRGLILAGNVLGRLDPSSRAS